MNSALKVTLDEATALCVAGDQRGARRLLFDRVDDALLASRWDEVNALLEQTNLETIEFELAVTLLMSTKPAASFLPARAEACERFLRRVQRAQPERLPLLAPFL